MKTKLFIFFLLVLSVIPLYSISNVNSQITISQNSLFGKNVYLLNSTSGTNSYLNTSFTLPSETKIHSIPVSASTVGQYLVGKWISAFSIPSSEILKSGYNFLFAMYGNGTGKARFYGEFFIYRNSEEISVFNTSQSWFLPKNNLSQQVLWQCKTNNQILFLANDKIVFKLYLNVSATGNFFFYYSCASYPSFLNDPTETRYLCDATSRTTVNNLLSFGLLTTETTSGDDTVFSTTIGIRVWIQHIDGSYTEVTSGTPVAQYSPSFPSGTSHVTATWTLTSNKSMVSSDSILVRVYGYSAGTWAELTDSSGYECDFQTAELGASQLNNATWTVVYYFYHVAHPAVSYFEWGQSSFPTQIQNFIWTVTPISVLHGIVNLGFQDSSLITLPKVVESSLISLAFQDSSSILKLRVIKNSLVNLIFRDSSKLVAFAIFRNSITNIIFQDVSNMLKPCILKSSVVDLIFQDSSKNMLKITFNSIANIFFKIGSTTIKTIHILTSVANIIYQDISNIKLPKITFSSIANIFFQAGSYVSSYAKYRLYILSSIVNLVFRSASKYVVESIIKNSVVSLIFNGFGFVRVRVPFLHGVTNFVINSFSSVVSVFVPAPAISAVEIIILVIAGFCLFTVIFEKRRF
jgi:hypothetical protein